MGIELAGSVLGPVFLFLELLLFLLNFLSEHVLVNQAFGVLFEDNALLLLLLLDLIFWKLGHFLFTLFVLALFLEELVHFLLTLPQLFFWVEAWL